MSKSSERLDRSPYLRAEQSEQRFKKLRKVCTSIKATVVGSIALELILADLGKFDAVHSSADAFVIDTTVVGFFAAMVGASVFENRRRHHEHMSDYLYGQHIEQLEASDTADDIRFLGDLYFRPDDPEQ